MGEIEKWFKEKHNIDLWKKFYNGDTWGDSFESWGDVIIVISSVLIFTPFYYIFPEFFNAIFDEFNSLFLLVEEFIYNLF